MYHQECCKSAVLCHSGTAKHKWAMNSAQAGRVSSVQGPTQRPPHKLAPGQPSFLNPHIQDLLQELSSTSGTLPSRTVLKRKSVLWVRRVCAPTESQECNAAKLSSAGKLTLRQALMPRQHTCLLAIPHRQQGLANHSVPQRRANALRNRPCARRMIAQSCHAHQVPHS